MTDANTQTLIERYKKLYPDDVGVSVRDLLEAEKSLGIKFPNDFKDIADAYGRGLLGPYSLFTFYDDLGDYNIVNKTLYYRECDLSLPHRYVALEETPSSFIVLETSVDQTLSGKVINCSIEDIYNLAEEKPLLYDPDIYESFAAFFEHLLIEEEEDSK